MHWNDNILIYKWISVCTNVKQDLRNAQKKENFINYESGDVDDIFNIFTFKTIWERKTLSYFWAQRFSLQILSETSCYILTSTLIM